MKPIHWVLMVALAGAGLAGCEGSTAPADEGVEEGDLSFLRFPPDLQPLVTPTGSFWAVKGESVEFVLRYQPEEPDGDGEEFLEFRVPGDGLLRRPNGSLFAAGDSVLITVTVATDGRFLFDFQPSGLRFDPEHPARLRIIYRRVEGDYDGDGDLDDDDEEFEAELGLWKQEQAGGRWFPVGAIELKDVDEIDGEISSFTGFAIAG